MMKFKLCVYKDGEIVKETFHETAKGVFQEQYQLHLDGELAGNWAYVSEIAIGTSSYAHQYANKKWVPITTGYRILDKNEDFLGIISQGSEVEWYWPEYDGDILKEL